MRQCGSMYMSLVHSMPLGFRQVILAFPTIAG